MNRLFLLLVTLTMLSCSSSNDLTRTKAKELIDAKLAGGRPAHFEFVPTDDEIREGQRLGLWKEVGLGYRTKVVFTDYGKKFFTSSASEIGVATVALIRPVIEITGIADEPMAGGGVKEVVYTEDWWSQMPSEVKGIFKNRKSSRQRVFMRMYDDGWRIGK